MTDPEADGTAPARDDAALQEAAKAGIGSRLGKAAIQVGITLLVITALYYFGLINPDDLIDIAGHPVYFSLAMLFVLSGQAVSAYRWFLLLRRVEVLLPYVVVLRVNLIAGLLSVVLPGSYGGDAARVVYVMRNAKGRRTQAVLAIMADRAFSALGLLVAAAALLPFHWTMVIGSGRFSVIAAVIVLGLAGTVVGAVILIFAAGRLRRTRWFADEAAGGRLRAIARQLTAFFMLFRKQPTFFLELMLLSGVAAISVAVSIVVLAQASAEGACAPDSVAFAAVAANIASAIPISPGGIGVGEIAFGTICQIMSGDNLTLAPYATVYLAFRLATILVGLIGSAGLYMMELRSRVVGP